ncbi:MAG: hypothetical protein KKF89_00805 [Nanoarchaeota archaeon]|nr:hypothetical protein [Nanoarchaeota archaeon]MBU1854236.1 hypothetical protein [Nanoarchaeota archaeon]
MPANGTKNLIPIRTHERAVELGRKGGSSKSPIKVLSSRINGSLNNKNLSNEQRACISLMADKNFLQAVNNLLQSQLNDASTWSQRTQIAKLLLELIPKQVLNANVSVTMGDQWARDVVGSMFKKQEVEVKCKQV